MLNDFRAILEPSVHSTRSFSFSTIFFVLRQTLEGAY